jgi:TetR/AcrR family transcriptional regulator, cholesterol catabolism regulator
MPVTHDAVWKTATRLFRTAGYHGTTTRKIAQELGVQGGSIYYHIASKEKLLFDILDTGIDDMTNAVLSALEGLTTPEEKLRAAISAQIHQTFEDFDTAAVLVALISPDTLSAEHRRIYIGKRDRYEQIFREIVIEGMNSGAFIVQDPKLLVFAVLGALNGMARWYRREGQYSLDEIADRFAGILLDGIKVRPACDE